MSRMELFLGAYRAGLVLLPARFRRAHGGAMVQCAAEMLEESRTLPTVALLMTDLFGTALREHLAMTFRIQSLYILASLFVVTTFIAGSGYLISQQVLRTSANDPQIQLAEDGAQRLTAGEEPAAIAGTRQVDLASSLTPFVMVFDESHRPIAASGVLNGTVPLPPAGVFDRAAKSEYAVTWQPRRGVRIALVMTHCRNGFVAAGRNMREVENREALMLRLAGLGWLVANAILVVLTLLAQTLSSGRQQLRTA